MKSTQKDIYNRKWITEKSIEIIDRYDKGVLTLRGLHYQLVTIGMTNTLTHYKRVVAAMIDARWNKLVSFDTFSDHDREMVEHTNSDTTILENEISTAKNQIYAWMTSYNKNRWENQPYYPEILIEKKALQGTFRPVCKENQIALGACKGYPSLTFLHELTKRFIKAQNNGKTPIILYFGDHDPSGEDIPRSIQENIIQLGCENIEIRRIALLKNQVIKWQLPPAPVKETDSRSAKWDGIGQVELDAIPPETLHELCQDAINEIFDETLYQELLHQERKERKTYHSELQEYVKNLSL